MEKSDRREQHREAWFTENVDPLLSRMVEVGNDATGTCVAELVAHIHSAK